MSSKRLAWILCNLIGTAAGSAASLFLADPGRADFWWFAFLFAAYLAMTGFWVATLLEFVLPSGRAVK